jgi:uncharacterized protein YraI
MIPLKAFLSAIQENTARITHYLSGGDGRDGGCDCIGLIIGAIRLAGGTWNGTHGSNYAARSEMTAFGRVSDLYLGEVVYKAKSPTDSGYALPDRYKGSGDLLDYYHVGVVTNVNPLIITHCTGVSGGIKEDNQPGQWKYGGQLKMVDYNDVLYDAIVTAATGRTVNLRANPSENSTILKAVPIGSDIQVYEEKGDWSRVKWNYWDGWMMNKFIVPAEPTDIYSQLKEARDALAHALAVIEGLMGGGVG